MDHLHQAQSKQISDNLNQGIPKSIPFFKIGKQMNDTNSVWLKTNREKLQSLLADEAKMMPMLENMYQTVKQMKAKQSFRLALINQLLEDLDDSND